MTSRGWRFRHHHAAAHTDRGENHDPTGTLITAQALNGGLDYLARNKRTVPSWLARMLARKPRMLVTTALANKMARIVWALLVKGGTYRAPAVAA